MKYWDSLSEDWAVICFQESCYFVSMANDWERKVVSVTLYWTIGQTHNEFLDRNLDLPDKQITCFFLQ